MQHLSTVKCIRNRLAAVVDGLAQMIRELPIRHLERDSGGIVRIMVAEYEWGELSAWYPWGQT